MNNNLDVMTLLSILANQDQQPQENYSIFPTNPYNPGNPNPYYNPGNPNPSNDIVDLVDSIATIVDGVKTITETIAPVLQAKNLKKLKEAKITGLTNEFAASVAANPTQAVVLHQKLCAATAKVQAAVTAEELAAIKF